MRTPAVVLALVVTLPVLGHIGAAQQAPAPARSTLRVLQGVVTADAGGPLQRVRVLVSAAGLSADPIFTNDYLIAAADRFDIDTEWLDAEVLVTLAPVAGWITLRDRQKLTTELDLIRRAR